LQAGISPLLEQLAAPTATPGGGSAAAAAGAMAASLGLMVSSMSRGKKAYLQHEAALSSAIARLAVLKEELQNAIDADAESFQVVMKAFKAQRDADPANAEAVAKAEAAVDEAMKGATLVPLTVAEKAHEVGNLVTLLTPITNPRAASDLAVGGLLAEAAKKGALANVEINLADLKDAAFATEVRSRTASLA
jgi:glutamate formiminotransferase/formiminotetrahydrofolate cyclodeaminase